MSSRATEEIRTPDRHDDGDDVTRGAGARPEERPDEPPVDSATPNRRRLFGVATAIYIARNVRTWMEECRPFGVVEALSMSAATLRGCYRRCSPVSLLGFEGRETNALREIEKVLR